MDETELRYLLIVLFVAGYDTSKNMLALTMKKMMEFPEYWEKCAESVEYAGKVTQEIFRYTSTATMSRSVNQEFEYEGVTFPVDTKLMFGNSTAGRDPRCFENADVFDPEREQTMRHVAFGRGVHVCLGQHLAQTQIAHGLQPDGAASAQSAPGRRDCLAAVSGHMGHRKAANCLRPGLSRRITLLRRAFERPPRGSVVPTRPRCFRSRSWRCGCRARVPATR